MFRIIAATLLAVIFFIITGVAIMLYFLGASAPFRVGTYSIFAPFMTGCMITYLAFIEIICWHKKEDAENRVLCELDPDTGYEIVCIGGAVCNKTVMKLRDLTTRECRIAVLARKVPQGFKEVICDDEAFLIPDGKSLVHGKVGDHIFTGEN